jgi:hypothetical protein
VLSLSAAEFERAMGKAPENQQEFDGWAEQAENLLNASIDWNALCQCACEAVQNAGDKDE